MVSQFLTGVISFLPALGILYFVLGAQEEFFRHQAMFLALIGGLIAGLVIAIPEFFILGEAGQGQTGALVVVLALPMLETMAKTVFVGLPRFRDKNETVLLGGAAGVTMAPMLLAFYGQFNQVFAASPLSWQLIVKVAGAAVGLTGAHYVSGLRLGMGPARGSLVSGIVPSFLWLLPAHVLLGGLGLVPVEQGFAVLRPFQGDWFWAVPLGLYGLAVVAWKGQTFLEKGLPRERRRELRRRGRI